MMGLSHSLSESPILILLLICHFFADFHLQSQEVADKKGQDRRFLLRHLVGVALLLLLTAFLQYRIWWILVLIFLSHALLDFFKEKIAELLHLNRQKSFLLDQTLHLVIIILLSKFTTDMPFPVWIDPNWLNRILFLVLITKPTNIAFRIFFQKYQPEEDNKMDTIPGAGAAIGFLERIIIGICILFGQFTSIGLVFTAKSIARYNKISENPAFAEYYLIGSLFSILSVLIAAWICLL
ncbi:DUF3307 domain-containing protein [Streptococcus pluranimalium]|uniref:DUF3307 domain-containing protein n=1 Tax=Streptococcus pluranimalium TaxID=82348 RepID=A0A345VK23_9STRE|nr:DUF3307 domain-containing protein [Streptococcus pluranimalium]AXJ13075.1 hypothetical protein Sp14A_11600 [Streptococcus pluranimalium]